MNTREFFIRQFAAERPKFVSVIRALPDEKLDYKPHERNSTARTIAWFLVLELETLVDVLTKGEHRWNQPEAPKTSSALAAEYEKQADAMEKALASANDEVWAEEAKLYFGDKLMMSRPRGEIVWDFFFDAIHHRGQLTAYLRPMGGKVPSIYGPTADTREK